MAFPNDDLLATFDAFCATFNKIADDKARYDPVQPFLHNHVTMHKVDDPSVVSGSPQTIVSYLNGSQIGLWPRFKPRTRIRNGGNITGDAMYQDKSGIDAILVQYCFRFVLVDNKVWKISTASATPT